MFKTEYQYKNIKTSMINNPVTIVGLDDNTKDELEKWYLSGNNNKDFLKLDNHEKNIKKAIELFGIVLRQLDIFEDTLYVEPLFYEEDGIKYFLLMCLDKNKNKVLIHMQLKNHVIDHPSSLMIFSNDYFKCVEMYYHKTLCCEKLTCLEYNSIDVDLFIDYNNLYEKVYNKQSDLTRVRK